MPVQIKSPAKGDDVRELWKIVAECVGVVNAIGNMKVIVEGTVKMSGELQVSGDSSRVEIRDNKEVANG